ncbi:hypothetical protein ABZ719_35955 [Streptomyces sp. NPDC006743]|uniref:hypothetical protein n=1 Tax=Streptomyces sp. NPDC006743 TaxID=3154480 RepID=UPI003451A0F6
MGANVAVPGGRDRPERGGPWAQRTAGQGLVGRVVVTAVAAAGLLAAAAGGAGATSVIGAGNSAHDNHCANTGSARTRQPDGLSAGAVEGGVLAVLLSAPANQCGDLGLPKEDKADQPAENAHVDVAE